MSRQATGARAPERTSIAIDVPSCLDRAFRPCGDSLPVNVRVRVETFIAIPLFAVGSSFDRPEMVPHRCCDFTLEI
jgi:hypothetical protein